MTIQPLSIALLFSLLSSLLTAQSIEFAPVGATWIYDRVTFSAGGGTFSEAVQVKYEEDIIIDSLSCKRLSSLEADYFIYQDGDKVYCRLPFGQQFNLLWDFGVMPGDTFLSVSPFNEFFENSGVWMICTARDTMWENEIALPRIHLTAFCDQNGAEMGHLIVNPRYGPMPEPGFCASYIIYPYTACQLDFAYYGLTQYRDAQYPEVNGCSVGTNAPAMPLINYRVYPNPTDQQLNLSAIPAGATMKFYDPLGRLALSAENSTGTLDISALHEGVYVVEIWAEGRKTGFVRVFKR